MYEVELPPEVKKLLNFFSVAVSFGFGGVSSVLECLNTRGYVAKLAVYMITPGVIVCAILLIGLARMLCRRPSAITATALLEWAAPYLLQLLFLCYPLVTTVAFDAFSCYEFTESEWLKADVSIECGTDNHERAEALAWVAIVIYPVGLLALNAALLFRARRAIRTQKATALSRAIAFVHREYEPHIFWWESRAMRTDLPRTAPPLPPLTCTCTCLRAGGSLSRCCAALCSWE